MPEMDYSRLVRIIRDRFPERLVPERNSQTVTRRQEWQDLEVDGGQLLNLMTHPDVDPPHATISYSKLGIDLAGHPITPEEGADRQLWRRITYGMAAGVLLCGGLILGSAIVGTPEPHEPSRPSQCTTYRYESAKGPVGIQLCYAPTPK